MRCLPDTRRTNFGHFERSPHDIFSFEGAFRYMLVKEYDPREYERLRDHSARGRWRVTGRAVDAGGANVPSPEPLIWRVLCGNGFLRREFGQTSVDIFLPDCFGFGYAPPSVAAHCGLKGFFTQELVWGSAIHVPLDTPVEGPVRSAELPPAVAADNAPQCPAEKTLATAPGPACEYYEGRSETVPHFAQWPVKQRWEHRVAGRCARDHRGVLPGARRLGPGGGMRRAESAPTAGTAQRPVPRVLERPLALRTVARRDRRESRPMRIAIDGVYFGVLSNLDAGGLISLVRACGAEGVNWPYHPEYLSADPKRAATMLADAGIAVVSLGLTEHIAAEPGQESRFRELFRQAAEVASILGTRVVDAWPRRDPAVSKDRAQATLAANLDAIASVAQASGVMLSLEFEPDTTLERYPEALDFVARWAPVAALTADTYHIIRVGDDLLAAGSALGKHIGVIHLSGSHRGEPGSEGDRCDHRGFVAAACAAGFSGDLVLQYAPPDDVVGSLTRAVALARSVAL